MFSVPLGNYTISGSQHYEQFNLLPKAIIPQTSAPVIESSLYLNEQPNWWNPGMPFPFCGDRVSFNQNNNPAYWRYFFNSIKTADISNDTFKLKLNVTAEMDYLAINWYTTVTNPTRSFILYWKDEGHYEIELFSMKLSGAEKLRQVHYYFHDYRKHTSAKQYFKVNQVMTDGSIIQSEWIEIELQNISEPLLPSKLFYPNPANYEVTFNSNGHYKVYNMNGALIKEFDLDTPSEILVEGWPRGIYTIIHLSGNQQLKERLVKN